MEILTPDWHLYQQIGRTNAIAWVARTLARCNIWGRGHFAAGRPASMPMTAEDCYARAAECDKRAGVVKRFEMKVQHREVAEQWRYLATEIERIALLRSEDRESPA